MSRWLHELPVALIALIVLVGVTLLVAAIHAIASRVADSGHGEAMRAVSPGLLSPLGVVFALMVGFLAAGVWGDSDKARDAVSTEASALRSVVLLSDQLPPAQGAQLRLLVRRHIDDAVHREWPAMRRQHESLAAIPVPLREAQQVVLSFVPRTPGQVDDQRELVAALGQALDARRQRIIISGSHVNSVKWLGLLALAAVMLVTIACVHSANRRGALLAMALFGVAVAVVLTMLVAQDQPFTGHLGQQPDLLEQVLPQI